MSGDGDFLSRWLRRKRVAADKPPAAPTAPSAAPSAAPIAAEARPDAEHTERRAARRALAEPVEIARLDRDSDLSVFFRDGMPMALRNRALAAIRRSDPVFANLDGLVEYGQDYRKPERIMETFDSAWQVGRGYLRDRPDDAETPGPYTPPAFPGPAPDGTAPAAVSGAPSDRGFEDMSVVLPSGAEPLAGAPAGPVALDDALQAGSAAPWDRQRVPPDAAGTPDSAPLQWTDRATGLPPDAPSDPPRIPLRQCLGPDPWPDGRR